MLKVLERVLGALGAIAGIVVAVDTYVLKSQLAAMFSLPATIPTGLFALVLLVFSLLYLASIRQRRSEVKREAEMIRRRQELESENAGIAKELQVTLERVSTLERQLHQCRAEREQVDTLRSKVIGVLAQGEADADQILRALHMPLDDPSTRQALTGVLGSLAEAGLVSRAKYSFGYRLMGENEGQA